MQHWWQATGKTLRHRPSCEDAPPVPWPNLLPSSRSMFNSSHMGNTMHVLLWQQSTLHSKAKAVAAQAEESGIIPRSGTSGYDTGEEMLGRMDAATPYPN